MRELGMLFSEPMVIAINGGWKTRTLRPIKPAPAGGLRKSVFVKSGLEDGHGREIRIPHLPDDRIYVRETFGYAESPEYPDDRPYKPVSKDFMRPVEPNGKVYVIYRADGDTSWSSFDGDHYNQDGTEKSYWMPSIHMPKEAARLWLEVDEIKVQRPQDLTDEEIMHEGIVGLSKDGRIVKYGLCRRDVDGTLLPYGGAWEWQNFFHTPNDAWRRLWTMCYGVTSWFENPYCFATTFKKIEVKP